MTPQVNNLVALKKQGQGPILLTWFNFNPNIDKSLHPW